MMVPLGIDWLGFFSSPEKMRQIKWHVYDTHSLYKLYQYCKSQQKYTGNQKEDASKGSVWMVSVVVWFCTRHIGSCHDACAAGEHHSEYSGKRHHGVGTVVQRVLRYRRRHLDKIHAGAAILSNLNSLNDHHHNHHNHYYCMNNHLTHVQGCFLM